MDIIKNIEINKNNFTNSELKFYNLIINNPKYIEAHSIVVVAEKCGTSKSAVLRFCQKIGYSGYSEFRYDFIRYLHYNDRTKTNYNISILSTTVSLLIDSISKLKSIEEAKIKKCLEKIHKSKIIRSIGIMDSSLEAKKFFYEFTKIGKNVFTITDIMELNFASNTIINEDLIIIFSLKGYINNAEDLFMELKEKNVDIILITCNKNAKFIKYAYETIIIPSENNSESLEHVLAFTFINILIEYYKELYI